MLICIFLSLWFELYSQWVLWLKKEKKKKVKNIAVGKNTESSGVLSVELSSCYFYFLFSLVSLTLVQSPGHRKYKVLVKLFSLAIIQTPKTENAKGQYVEIHSGVLAGNSKGLVSSPHFTVHLLLTWGKKLHFSGLLSSLSLDYIIA